MILYFTNIQKMRKSNRLVISASIILLIILYVTIKPTLPLINLGINNNSNNQLTQSKVFDLSNKGLSSLTTQFFNNNKDCEELDLSGNELTGALPAEIRLMSKLKIINASNNNLTGIPAEIGQLKQLEILDLSNNKIDTIPDEIKNIKDNLKILNLSGNTYSKETIGRIKQMLPDTQVISD